MIKILTGAGLLVVIVASAVALHHRHILSRQRSLSAYNAITSYHAKVVEAAASGQRYIPERGPDENLLEGDPGYAHLKRMAQVVQELSLRTSPPQKNSSYEACDTLVRHDLNLSFDPKHSYNMSMEIARTFCGRWLR
jgi:hypothetical protein